MEKAIDIKRRAQRYIQSGDLDGALGEYEKLVSLPDCDPYNFVLLADLLFKRGEIPGASDRYLSAAALYEKSSLYKNAIAVCKKMMRLSLAPGQVLERLANLHVLDGLGSEAALYFQQFAEYLLREQQGAQAAVVLRKAYEADPDEIRLLERASEAHALAGETDAAAAALAEAAYRYRKRGMPELAAGCRENAERIKPGTWREYLAQNAPGELGDEPAIAAAPESGPEWGADLDSDGERESESAVAVDGGSIPGEDSPAEPGCAPPALTAADLEPRSNAGEADARGAAKAPMAGAGPEAPSGVGLDFDPPAVRAEAASRPAPMAAREPAAHEPARTPPLRPQEIEGLLDRAQESLRGGDPEGAERTLIEAARAYEFIGRFESAVTIYRGVVRNAASPAGVLELWLANAERRDASQEAAEVACQLGDLALAAGDPNAARRWFGRAQKLDENNAQAQRRLQRLDPAPPPEAGPPSQMAVEVPPARAATPERRSQDPASREAGAMASGAVTTPTDRVELALGRSEAVNFDLGSLLSEFHRGIEAQLSGDAQGHYDLAMAYREMGLLDHAVDSFRLALSSPALAPRATEMLCRSLLDQGRFEEVVQELYGFLERPGLDGDAEVSLRYLLGLALEAAGRPQDALAEFEAVFERQGSFQDVAQKLRDLRKILGSA